MKISNRRVAPPVVASSSRAARSRNTESKPAAPQKQQLTVDLPGIGTKTYTFPTRFHDVDLSSAQFLLPSSAVAQWLPPGLEPASTLGVTKGLITFQHLGNPEEMAPYSEAQLAVRVKDARGNEAWHVLEMPVDSAENMQRGKIIFGYPKSMATVDAGAGGGTARTPSGAELFSLRIGAALPFGLDRHVDNEAVQVLNGELVKLSSWAEGKMKPALASVELSDELRRRYPGMPAHPVVLFGGRLEGGELSLSLPSKA